MSKVTVITGGTSGIGRGIVEKILANSAEDDLIFATYAHNAYKANEFWDNLKPEDQEKLIILKADMSSYDDMINFVGEVKEKAGHVDWLISNAGISTYDKFQDYTFEEWNKIVNTDRKSTRLNSSHQCISYAVFCLKKTKGPVLFLDLAYSEYPGLVI